MMTPATHMLDRLGIEYWVKVHAGPVYTAEQAAAQRHVMLSQVTKAMIVTSAGGLSLCVLIPGDRRLSLARLADSLGEHGFRLARRKEVERMTGYEVGAITPLGLQEKGLRILLDRGVLEQEWVTISAGTPEAGILLRSADLARAVNATVGTFAEP